MPKPTATEVESRLRDALQAAEVVVIDTSSGCGSSFDVAVVSSMFEGKGLLQRHRLVSAARQGRCCILYEKVVRASASYVLSHKALIHTDPCYDNETLLHAQQLNLLIFGRQITVPNQTDQTIKCCISLHCAALF